MFNGSEHYDKEFQDPLERAGATDLNGTTNEDRTNYFANVPTSALDLALWLESDRMGHLLGALTQAKLDEQRGVVQNEKRQGENEPYGKVWDFLTPRLYPANHPYSWTVIGSMEDLDAAKLDDVKAWFQSYYGPANAVLVVAGDIDVATAKAKVERYFGDIPSGPPVTRQETWIAKRSGSQRGVMQDRVPQARLYKVWNVPEWGSADGDYLGLAASALSTGKSSRLFKRLVYDEQIATDVDASVDLREIGGLFTIEAGVRPGVDPARVERAIDEELARLLAAGPTAVELQRAKTQTRAGFIRGVERIGGFGGKSDVLAKGEVFAGRPDSLQDAARADRRRHRGAGPGRGGALALGRRVHARGAALPRVRGGAHRGRPVRAAAGRHAPGREIPRARARHALQRPQDRPGRAPVDSAGAVRPAARRGLRGGSVRPAGHGQPRDEHARRGHRHAHGPPDQRPPRRPRRHAGRRVPARRVERVARDAARAARPRAGALRRRHPPSRLPQGRLRAAPEAAPGPDPAREGRPDRHGAPGPAPRHLR